MKKTAGKLEEKLWHQSGVNRAGEPFIQLIRNGQVIMQMSPAEAREHAAAMVEAAEAAEQDAFMWGFAIERLGMPELSAGQILIEYRKFREDTTKKKGGPIRPSDWTMPKNLAPCPICGAKVMVNAEGMPRCPVCHNP